MLRIIFFLTVAMETLQSQHVIFAFGNKSFHVAVLPATLEIPSHNTHNNDRQSFHLERNQENDLTSFDPEVSCRILGITLMTEMTTLAWGPWKN